MKPDRYFSVDIESSGPIPGRYSMLSLGACAVDEPEISFYVEFQPISADFIPEAMNISGFDLDELKKNGTPPLQAMADFKKWIDENSAGKKPVFVGFNASYDWQFVNWYFETFSGSNPFGFGAVDIKSFFMGLEGEHWSASSSSQLPKQYQPDTPQTHNALEDAKAQASIFSKMQQVARVTHPKRFSTD